MTQQPHGSVASIPSGGLHGATHEVLGRLAVGGMAELYLARTTHTDGRREVVVLKRILPHLAEDPDFVRMFRDEAFLAATLDHHNIVRVYDIGQDGEDYFFTMEYVHGENVRTLIKAAQKARAQVPLHAVLQIAYGVCEGLHYAHEQKDEDGSPLNIVHRDVSPTNILVAHDGQVKIVDFGIAKAAAATHVTQAGMLKGKASYMSPEQCRAQQVDRRSDVFAIGILLYEVTTLTRLFRGENELAVMHKILMGEIDPPSGRIEGSYDKDLERIVMRALDPDPAKRYPTALALKQDLERFASTRRAMPSAGGLGEVLRQLCGDKPYPWGDEDPEEFEADDLSVTSASTAVSGSSEDEEDTHVNRKAMNLQTVVPGGASSAWPEEQPDDPTGTTNRRIIAARAAGSNGLASTLPAPAGASGRTLAPTGGDGPPVPRPFSAKSGSTLPGAGGGLGGPLPARSGRTIKGPPGSAAAVEKPPAVSAPLGQSRLPNQGPPTSQRPPAARAPGDGKGADATMALGAGSRPIMAPPKPRRRPGLSSTLLADGPPPAPSAEVLATQAAAAHQKPGAAQSDATMALTPEQAKQMAAVGNNTPPTSEASVPPPAWHSTPSNPDPDEVDEGARTIAVNRFEHTMLAGSAHDGEVPKGPMGWRSSGSEDPLTSTQRSPVSDPLTSTVRSPVTEDPRQRSPSASFGDGVPGNVGRDLRRPQMRSPAPRPQQAGRSVWLPMLLLVVIFALAGATGWFWVSGTGPFAP